MTDAPVDDAVVAALPMDPRIRARRIQVRRDEGRRRLRLVVGVLGAMVAAGAAYGTTRTPLLDVDEIAVAGARQSGADAVREATGIPLGRLLTEVDESAAEAGVESLPWVERATVERRWPNALQVEVVERVAVASVPAGEAWAALDRGGRVLEISPEPPRQTVVRAEAEIGDPGTIVDPLVRPGIEVAAVLPDRVRARVAELRVAEGQVEAVLASGALVRVGEATELPDKLIALETVLAKADLRGVTIIDVRVPSAPALTRA